MFALRLASLGLAFLATVLLAHSITPGQLGVYVWATSLVVVLQMFAVVGFDVLSIREGARGRATDDPEQVAGVLKAGRRVVSVTSFVVAALLITFAVVALSGERQSGLIILALTVPAMALTTVRQAVLQSFGRVVSGRLPEDLLRPALIVALILIVPLCGVALDSDRAIAIQAVAIGVAFLAGTAVLRKLTPKDIRSATPVRTSGQWASDAFPLGLLGSGGVLLTQLPLILLGALSTTEQAAAFAVASRLAVLASLPEVAFNAAFMPTIARLHATGQKHDLARSAAGIAAGGTALAAMIAAPMILLPALALGVFGDAGAGHTIVLQLLCAAWIVNAMAGTNGSLLTMSGEVRPVAWSLAIGLATNLIASIALVPSYGASGAAWAWLLTIGVWNLSLAVSARQRLGFWASPIAHAFRLLRRR